MESRSTITGSWRALADAHTPCCARPRRGLIVLNQPVHSFANTLFRSPGELAEAGLTLTSSIATTRRRTCRGAAGESMPSEANGAECSIFGVIDEHERA